MAALILFISGGLLALRSPGVQTTLTHEIAAYYSSKLNTRVTVGKVDVEFFKKFVLSDVYVEDQHKDTLIYFSQLKLNLSRLSFSKRELSVSDLEVVNPRLNLIRYADEKQLNFQFILDAFANTNKSSKDSLLWKVRCEEILLHNLSFAYKDLSDTSHSRGMNYSDLECSSVYGDLKNIHFKKDTVYVTIEQLSAREKCGFVLNDLLADVSVSPSGMKFRKLVIKTPGSSVHGNFDMLYSRYVDFQDFISKVEIKGTIDSGKVNLADVAFFAPALHGLQRTISFSGSVTGKVSALKGRKLKIQLDKSSVYEGDIDLDSIPNPDKMVLKFKANRFTTTVSDLQHFPLYPFDSGRTIGLPSAVAPLGEIVFKGQVAGLLSDFGVSGEFATSLGNLTTALSFGLDKNSKNGEDEFSYKGKLASGGFDLGKIAATSKLGTASFDAKVEGKGTTFSNAAFELNGSLTSISILGYAYKNMLFSANLKDKIFAGNLTVNDDNCRLKCDMGLDLSQSLPLLTCNATVQQANISALGLIKGKKAYSFSTDLSINASGNSIENLTGKLALSAIHVRADKENYVFNSFSFASAKGTGGKQLTVSSDFLDGELSGTYKFKELGGSVENLLSGAMPAYFSSIKLKTTGNQNFDLNLRFKKTTDFAGLFFPSFSIADGSQLTGSYNSSQGILKASVLSPGFSAFNTKLKNLDLKADMKNGRLNMNITSDRVSVKDSVYFKNFNLSLFMQNDSSLLDMQWANHSHPDNNGSIKAKLICCSGPGVVFGFLPSEITVTDSIWKVNSSNRVTLDSSHLEIRQLEFSNNLQKISIDGSFSKFSNDSLYINLSQFNLATLNRWSDDNMKFKGLVNGTTILAGKFNSSMIISNLAFKGLKVNNQDIGEGYLKSTWESWKNALALDGSFGPAQLPNLLFTGFYFQDNGNKVDLNFNLNALNLEIFKPYVKEYCRDFSGAFSGKLNLKGAIAKPEFSGLLSVDAKKITVDYLGTSYSFKHDIRIEPGSFSFDDLELHDKESGTALVKSGKILHDNFSNFRLDVDFAPTKLMVLNTTSAENSLYYGQAYVSGPSVKIYGVFNKMIFIDANVKTDKVSTGKKSSLTKLYIPLSNSGDVGENNFISFVNHDTSAVKKNKYTVNLSGFTLNFDLDVTSDAEVHLIFDQKIGDVINAVGTGQIKLEINSLGKFDMLGNYTVVNGDYLFTLGNVINKKFSIDKGATIKWSGNPYEAEINLDAVYKLKTSLFPYLWPIPGMDSTTAKKRYPVECKLLLTNKLTSPDVAFEVDLPTVDESTRSYVRSVINTDLEINRQVFSLMVLGSFITPQSMSGGSSASDLLPSSGVMAGSELFTNQLNNMLGKVSNDVDVGVRVAGDKLNNEDLQVALSTQLLNNRLSLDGNFGKAAGVTQNTNTLVGDMNVEYKLTNDGKLRLKAFNRTNDNTIINISSPYTQGVGIFYREEFNTLTDLKRRFLKYLKKKQDAKAIK